MQCQDKFNLFLMSGVLKNIYFPVFYNIDDKYKKLLLYAMQPVNLIFIQSVNSLNRMQDWLQQIIQTCSEGKEINNFQIRSIIISLATNLASTIQTVKLNKQANVDDSQNNNLKKNLAQIREDINQKSTLIKDLDRKVEKLNKNTFQYVQIQTQKTNVRLNIIQDEIFQNSKKLQVENRFKTFEQRFILFQNCIKDEINTIEIKLKKFFDNLCQSVENSQKQKQIVNKQNKQYVKNKKQKEQKKQMKQINKIKLTKQMKQQKQYTLAQILRGCLNRNFTRSKQIVSCQWVDSSCNGFSGLKINSNKITAKQKANIFCKFPLKPYRVFRIVFRIEKLSKYICLGIADSTYKDKSSTLNLPNLVAYSSNGECRQERDLKINQGDKFKQGEQVAMKVDLYNGTIQWRVDSSIRFKLQCNELIDENIKWVPYIVLSEQNQCVSLFE